MVLKEGRMYTSSPKSELRAELEMMGLGELCVCLHLVVQRAPSCAGRSHGGPAPSILLKNVVARLLCKTPSHAGNSSRATIEHYQQKHCSMDNEGTELVEAYGAFAPLPTSSKMLAVLMANVPASPRLLIQVHSDRYLYLIQTVNIQAYPANIRRSRDWQIMPPVPMYS